MPAALTRNLTLLFLLVIPSVAIAAAKTDAATVAAPGWQTVVTDYANAPSFLIAVDKKEQQLRIFERKSPLVKVAEYTITTGQNHGDKLVEGDMKTPEGVYFVVKYINSGLDYALYGTEAYPLNYPNPVDRLRKKTGYGIWIHGKGIPLVPYDSNGCVGMNNQDILKFKERSLIGQPVTLALAVLEPTPDKAAEKSATSAMLTAKVADWARAWSNRSAEMFDFYDQNAYSLAQGQSFSSFRAQKEQLFKALPWIKTTVSDVQALEGPGYWVTWFNQNYEAPNLKSWGTRRLYWQPDAQGQLRIVGMEWIKNFKSPELYADAGSKNPQAAVSDAAPVMSATAPQSAPFTQVTVKPVQQPATAVQVAAAEPTEQKNNAASSAVRNAQPDSSATKLTQDQQEIDKMLAAEAREFIDKWKFAWKTQNLDLYMRCYADKAMQDARKGKNWITSQKKDLWTRVKIVKLDLSDIQIETTNSGLKATMLQTYQDSTGYSDTGRKTLHLEFDKAWHIVREEWSAVN